MLSERRAVGRCSCPPVARCSTLKGTAPACSSGLLPGASWSGPSLQCSGHSDPGTFLCGQLREAAPTEPQAPPEKGPAPTGTGTQQGTHGGGDTGGDEVDTRTRAGTGQGQEHPRTRAQVGPVLQSSESAHACSCHIHPVELGVCSHLSCAALTRSLGPGASVGCRLWAACGHWLPAPGRSTRPGVAPSHPQPQ